MNRGMHLPALPLAVKEFKMRGLSINDSLDQIKEVKEKFNPILHDIGQQAREKLQRLLKRNLGYRTLSCDELLG